MEPRHFKFVEDPIVESLLANEEVAIFDNYRKVLGAKTTAPVVNPPAIAYRGGKGTVTAYEVVFTSDGSVMYELQVKTIYGTYGLGYAEHRPNNIELAAVLNFAVRELKGSNRRLFGNDNNIY